jgi:hypothetical protein
MPDKPGFAGRLRAKTVQQRDDCLVSAPAGHGALARSYANGIFPAGGARSLQRTTGLEHDADHDSPDRQRQGS